MRNMLLEGDLLSVYSRVFADTGENGVAMPVKNPMSGTGLRWKPLRDQIFFLAVEQQLPQNGQNGASANMLRASSSFFNGGKYSDEWRPHGSGWFAQNLYLDAAQYVRQDIQAWTADYRVSWHQKVANGQTIEPYAHVQDNGYRDKGTQGAQLGGVGVAGISGPARRTMMPGRTKSVSASNISIPLRRLINVAGSATTRFSPLECTGKCVS